MRKDKLVTRSIEWCEVDVLGLNTAESKPETRHFVLPSKMTEEKKIISYLQATNTDENFTPVKTVDITVKSELRGLSEREFIAHSHHIENRHNAKEV